MFRYLSLLAVMLSAPSFASIELHMSGRDIDECQYLYAYDDASLEDNLEEIMAGNLTPVRFEVRVIHRNELELNVFTRDTDVIDVEHPHVSDWQDVVSEALDWIRQERTSLAERPFIARITGDESSLNTGAQLGTLFT